MRPNPHRRRSGVTLIELLVAIALIALLVGLLMRVLIPGLSLWKHTRAIARVEQEVLIAQERMTESLLETHQDTITVLDDPDLKAFSVLSHKGSGAEAGYDPLTGQTEWETLVIYRLKPSEGELSVLEWDGTSPSVGSYPFATTELFRVTPDDLRTLCNSSLPAKPLCRTAGDLQLVQEAPAEQWLLTLEVTAHIPNGERPMTRQLRLRPRIKGDFS